jgi:hypothetical protein
MPLSSKERLVAERCIEIAETYSDQMWRLYKRGWGPERADPHWQGLSDGAAEVAELIRKEFKIAAKEIR